MGGKKGGKGKKGKKGKKGGAFGEEAAPEEKRHIYFAELDSLNMRMAAMSQKAEEARAGDNEKRKHDMEMMEFER